MLLKIKVAMKIQQPFSLFIRIWNWDYICTNKMKIKASHTIGTIPISQYQNRIKSPNEYSLHTNGYPLNGLVEELQ